MTLDLLQRHLLATIASHELIGGQLHAMRVQLNQMIAEQRPRPTAAIVLPDRCRNEREEDCGRQCADAISQRPGWAPMCKGCGLAPTDE